jgi:hypothetical protein
MPRSCICDRWLTRAAADLGFQALPAAAQLLFFRLLASAAGAEERGRVRFPVPVSIAVSRILNRTETEAETDIAALVDLGWIEIDTDGRSVWMAGAKAQAGRVEAAQINGLRGGRPRKGETPEQARARKQGSLMLPMAGGAEKPTETEREPGVESSRAAAASSSTVQEAAAAGARDGWVSLAQRCAEIAGIDPARGGWNALPVKGWVDAGVPEDVILETVRTVAARPRRSPIGSLMFFHQAVMQAHQAAPAPAGKPSMVDGYQKALREWQANGAQGVPPSLAEWQAGRVAA